MIQETPLDQQITEELAKQEEVQNQELLPLIGPTLPNLDNLEAPIPNSMVDDIEDEELTHLTSMGSYPNLGNLAAEAKMEEELNIYPTPEEYQVKVFVINQDGNWSDCGVGVLIFLNNFEITVCTDGNDQAGRDFMEDDRADAMRGNIGKNSEPLLGVDRGEIILKIDLREGREFSKSQSKNFNY